MATRLHFLLLALWSLGQIDLPLVLGQFGPRTKTNWSNGQQSNLALELGLCQGKLAQAPPEFGGYGGVRWSDIGDNTEVLKCILDLLQKLLEQWPDPNGP